MKRGIFTLLFFLLTCTSFAHNLRQITFINLLPHTRYRVTVTIDGRPHWAIIPQAKAGNNSVTFAVFEWTEEITISVSPEKYNN